MSPATPSPQRKASVTLISSKRGGEVSSPDKRSGYRKETRSCSDRKGEEQPRRLPLSVAEAADYLNVPERFVRRLIAERQVPFLKVGYHVRLRPEDLDAYLEDCVVEPPQLRRRDLGVFRSTRQGADDGFGKTR
jgi:excisionase family DNA binding protein